MGETQFHSFYAMDDIVYRTQIRYQILNPAD
jgi:hypothetical protein